MPLTQEKISKINFGRGNPWAEGFSFEGATSKLRKAPFSSTCIEEMRNSSSRQVRLAHYNSLAKAWSYTQRRLTHHLVFFHFFILSARILLTPTGYSF